MRLQACLNGSRSPASHPALPQTAEGLALDARATMLAGAEAVHLHIWQRERETLAAAAVGDTVRRVRAAAPEVPIGVSTGLWIYGSATERLAAVQGWTDLPGRGRPDYASVNFSEAGAEEVCAVLLDLGIGIGAGLESMADAERLKLSGQAGRCLRWLIELSPELDEAAALYECGQIHTALDALDSRVERLTHGSDGNAWALLAEAHRRGDATRIGMEDTLLLPDGQPAPDNAALLRAALELLDAR